ncbi:MAG: PilZ domain-containing protein [Elusimicrobia bacterium]|nr:PilZ domain-containing protein [Elusimicrobiota bacterium]
MKASHFFPVRFQRGQDSQEGWGRLLEIHSSGAKLLTSVPIRAEEEIFISFEIEDHRFESLRSKVSASHRDADGYAVCELQFVGFKERVDLQRALTDVLVRRSFTD